MFVFIGGGSYFLKRYQSHGTNFIRVGVALTVDDHVITRTRQAVVCREKYFPASSITNRQAAATENQ